MSHSSVWILQALAAILALLSAWAWAKSALDQLRPDWKNKGSIDRLLNRISRQPGVWNAIAAFLAALAAVTQAIFFLTTMPD